MEKCRSVSPYELITPKAIDNPTTNTQRSHKKQESFLRRIAERLEEVPVFGTQTGGPEFKSQHSHKSQALWCAPVVLALVDRGRWNLGACWLAYLAK